MTPVAVAPVVSIETTRAPVSMTAPDTTARRSIARMISMKPPRG
jgi:hypothetical protein